MSRYVLAAAVTLGVAYAARAEDTPAPDDEKTPLGGGGSGPDDICPPYTSAVSQRNRSESREVIRRFRSLSPADQLAMIEFLKQL